MSLGAWTMVVDGAAIVLASWSIVINRRTKRRLDETARRIEAAAQKASR